MSRRHEGVSDPRQLGSAIPERQVRAQFDERTIRVYQAFSPEIARKALSHQTLKPPFKRERMTWIKPSFTWMMYRSGWGRKPDQEHVLGIDILRTGFEWALAHSCITHFQADLHGNPEEWRATLRDAPVRIQWDPEKSLRLDALPWRTIQVGLCGQAVNAYVDDWISRIEDVTPLAREVETCLTRGDLNRARSLAPIEVPYPLPREIIRRINGDAENVIA